MANCPYCGSEVQEGIAVCPHCNAQLSAQPVPQEVPKNVTQEVQAAMPQPSAPQEVPQDPFGQQPAAGQQNTFNQQPFGQPQGGFGQQPVGQQGGFGQPQGGFGQQQTFGQPANFGGAPNPGPAPVSTGGLMAWSIVTMLLCLVPGIVALINVLNVNKVTTLEEQQKKLSSAKMWCIIGTVLGILSLIGQLAQRGAI